ncbi:MarR family transcriptional regulator [Cetobacterium sp. 2A]|uniref:MarR family winged helix-turn-helix transcriptional regulator n=1 Tax=Cetobacterium sp. 2A TaxID=2754723 RepID=UPI00163CBE9F|nr:MarR family transcriptional regulator [Cetobacterium sp. 2A]MBC2855185.1 MarR family transcriptional regulator [Cetobacterium sp. 2A]
MRKGMIALISAITKEIDYKSVEILYDLNITKMEAVYLRIIHEYPGISQYEIAKKQNTDKTLVIKHITNLENKNFIIKKEIDSRKKGVYLTVEGDKAVNFVNENLENFEEELFKGVEEKEVDLLFNMMTQLKERLELSNRRDHFSYNFKK